MTLFGDDGADQLQGYATLNGGDDDDPDVLKDGSFCVLFPGDTATGCRQVSES